MIVLFKIFWMTFKLFLPSSSLLCFTCCSFNQPHDRAFKYWTLHFIFFDGDHNSSQYDGSFLLICFLTKYSLFANMKIESSKFSYWIGMPIWYKWICNLNEVWNNISLFDMLLSFNFSIAVSVHYLCSIFSRIPIYVNLSICSRLHIP